MGKVKCLQCGKVLVSKHVHDFVECECSNRTFVDGGDEYTRFGGIDMEKVQVLE